MVGGTRLAADGGKFPDKPTQGWRDQRVSGHSAEDVTSLAELALTLRKAVSGCHWMSVGIRPKPDSQGVTNLTKKAAAICRLSDTPMAILVT
jgi:hypothetical protein